MGYQEEIRKQQLLDRINIIKHTLPIPEEDVVEPIRKSLFDEFEVTDVETIEKSLNVIGDILGEEAVDDIEKAISHKYFKREGTKGNYKYYYTEADYKSKKQMSPDERDVVEFDEEHEDKSGDTELTQREEHEKFTKELEKIWKTYGDHTIKDPSFQQMKEIYDYINQK